MTRSQAANATWPEGYRSAFVMTVGFEADLAILAVAPDAVDRAKSLSVGRYGATRGVRRLLAELDRTGTPGTWFVPSRNIQKYLPQVRDVLAAGHEFGNSGVALENFSTLDLAEQITRIEQAQSVFGELLGVQPTGFRAGRGEYADGLPTALVEAGFTWSSSWLGDDVPFFHIGEASNLVEIPVHFELDDFPYFVFNLDPPIPAGSPRIASAREVLGNWIAEFDAYREEGLCFVLTLHPEIIATPGRTSMLAEFLDHVHGHSDVWIATGGEVAAWWTQHGSENSPSHPAEVFARARHEIGEKP